MWENHYRPIWKDIPGGRHKDTIRALRRLIADMYVSGYSMSSIGRFLGKDHTTIVHHIKQIGTKDTKRIRPDTTRALADKRFRIEVNHERSLQRIALANKRTQEMEERKMKREEATKRRHALALQQKREMNARRAEIQALRQQVFEMYKAGASYRAISIELGISNARVQALLIYHPGFRKIMRPRYTNTGRPVDQYTKEGKFVKRFNTCIAAARALGVPRNHISLVARGRARSTHGFTFKYVT